MKLALPIAERWSRSYQLKINGILEQAFSRLNEYALVPEGGSSGDALVKASDRSLDLAWGSGGGGGSSFTTNISITTTGGQINMYETDAADPLDRGLIEQNGGQLVLWGYDASAATFHKYFYGDATTGAVLVGNTGGGITLDGDTSINGTLDIVDPDTTLSRKSAGRVNVEGVELVRARRAMVAISSGTADTSVRGNVYNATGGFEIPASTFTGGDYLDVYNNSASSITLTQGAGLTLRLAGTATTGNRTLAQRGACRILFITATQATAFNWGGLT